MDKNTADRIVFNSMIADVDKIKSVDVLRRDSAHVTHHDGSEWIYYSEAVANRTGIACEQLTYPKE